MTALALIGLLASVIIVGWISNKIHDWFTNKELEHQRMLARCRCDACEQKEWEEYGQYFQKEEPKS